MIEPSDVAVLSCFCRKVDKWSSVAVAFAACRHVVCLRKQPGQADLWLARYQYTYICIYIHRERGILFLTG